MKDLFGKFKEYKNIFGKPGTGVHKLKFKGTSLFDYFATIVLAFVVTYMSNIPLVWSTIILFIIGIRCRWVQCSSCGHWESLLLAVKGLCQKCSNLGS